MKLGKKSFAQELAELANPAPIRDTDPEADLFGAGPILEASDDDLATVARKIGVRRRGSDDIVLESVEYAGKVSSKASLFHHLGIGTDKQNAPSEYSEESEEDEISDDAAGNVSHLEDKEQALEKTKLLEEGYRRIHAADTISLETLKDRAAKEKRKAVAVLAQSKLWKSFLELRILLQRGLSGSHRLPRGEGYAAVIEAVPSSEAATALKALTHEAHSTLTSLLELTDALMQNNPAILDGQDSFDCKRKRSDTATLDDLWQMVDDSYTLLVPFRNASIDRWHRKTLLAAGTAAAKGNLRVLNQSISAQVSMMVADPGRLIKRARLPKGHSTPLCEIERVQENEDGLELSVLEEEDDRRDPETFDDTEFYQTLLKEYLEKSDVGQGNWYSGPKQRKQVDRRASKGRKIRYDIHEKLVNFMTPLDVEPPHSAKLFSALFGGG